MASPPRWRHQDRAFAFARDKQATMLAMAMGTGKSRVVCDLLSHWDSQLVLVACPCNVRGVWRREFAKWAPRYRVVVLDRGTVATQTQVAKSALQTDQRPLAVVQNYESLWRPPFNQLVMERVWDAIVADESHRFGPHGTRISKFMMRISNRARRRLCLSGTPMVRDPLSIFGQYRFLAPSLFGIYWTRFRNTYAQRTNPVIPQMITGYKNLDILQQKFGLLAYQVSADVLDLPEAQHHIRSFELPAKARKIYKDLELDFCAMLDDGFITAANALVKTLRLRQCVNGFLQPDDVDSLTEVHASKSDELRELLEDLSDPVVVFCEFKADMLAVKRVCKKLGRRYGEVSGNRRDLTDKATMPEEIDVLAVQYQAGGLGIDLTRSSYVIIYSACWSLGNYDQALARVHRPGQRRHVQFYHLIAENTVDETVYKALASKRNVIESVLEGLRKRQEV